MDNKTENIYPNLTCFSKNHGENVILSEGNTVAYR